MALGVTLVCLAFYIWWPDGRSQLRRQCQRIRWVFWMAPLWLMLMLPAADLLAIAAGRGAWPWCLLALSVLSASYPTWNPWTPPWIMNFLGYMGWVVIYPSRGLSF